MKEEDIKDLIKKVDRLGEMVEERLEELKEMIDAVEGRLFDIERLIKRKQ